MSATTSSIPVVTLSTKRVVHRLLDDERRGPRRARATTASPRPSRADVEPESWREWEVELVNGDEELLEAADALLRSAGATPATGPSKLARALGDRVPAPGSMGAARQAPDLGHLFRAYAGAQVQAIRERDPEVRRDVPDSIHKFRVATRRLRSALATYRPVVDREAGDQIRAELKWLAGELGVARDAEVQREHFAAEVAEQPVELVMGRVAGRIDDHLRRCLQGGPGGGAGRAGERALLPAARHARRADRAAAAGRRRPQGGQADPRAPRPRLEADAEGGPPRRVAETTPSRTTSSTRSARPPSDSGTPRSPPYRSSATKPPTSPPAPKRSRKSSATTRTASSPATSSASSPSRSTSTAATPSPSAACTPPRNSAASAPATPSTTSGPPSSSAEHYPDETTRRTRRRCRARLQGRGGAVRQVRVTSAGPA